MASQRLRVANTPEEPDAVEDGLHDVPATEVRTARTNWLWRDRLEWGTVAMLQGAKGAGKSTWLRTIAAHVTGGPLLPGTGKRRKALGNVLWYAGEEPIDTRVRPGLVAAGADLDRVYLADALAADNRQHLALPADCDRLAKRIAYRSAVLVCIDPVFTFCDPTADLTGPTHLARDFMLRIGRVAKQTGAAIILTRNLTKDTSRGALSAGRGSAELGNAARSVLHAQAVPGVDGCFALAVAACNAGRPVPSVTYELVEKGDASVVRVSGDADLSADQLAAGEEGDLDRWQKDRAVTLLRALLTEGKLDSRTIRDKAEQGMISLRTLQAAAKQIGVRYQREGTREQTVSYWLPPEGGFKS